MGDFLYARLWDKPNQQLFAKICLSGTSSLKPVFGVQSIDPFVIAVWPWASGIQGSQGRLSYLAFCGFVCCLVVVVTFVCLFSLLRDASYLSVEKMDIFSSQSICSPFHYFRSILAIFPPFSLALFPHNKLLTPQLAATALHRQLC